ncbi:MAG: hypothetical protein HOY69_36700, partial [Streptomyces sp.]|nr:hypothetical protein [Streptomyces sp.]
AHDFGRLRADTLSLQMKMLLGDWQQHIADGMWYHDQRQDEVLLDPLFAAELLPLLVRHDRCAPRLALRPLPRIKQRAPEAVAALVADYEARAAEPGFRPVFGAPDFDAAVHAVADRLAADPAFRASAEPRHPDGPLVAVISRGAGPQDPSGPVDPSDPAGTSRGRSSRSLPERALVRQPSAADREALCARAWTELKAALRLWRPVSEDHIAPVSLLADPVLAELITPERGREILAMPRGAAAAGA